MVSSRFGAFDVTLGGLESFGDRVAYLSVVSPRIHDLHTILVALVNPSSEERARYHELEPYTPHLTLRRGKKLDFADIALRVEKLAPLSPFTVESIWLFRQEVSGQPYRRVAEFPLV